MADLSLYASIAEIFSATAIVGGALFAIVQLNEYKRRRRNEAAAELCRQFTQPELAKAFILLNTLPDGLGIEEYRKRGPEYEEAAQVVGMTFETMGLLVYKDMASFRTVQELAGGLLLMTWRKSGDWVKEVREVENNPRFGEWAQWLAERLSELEPEMIPAYQKHSDWNKYD